MDIDGYCAENQRQLGLDACKGKIKHLQEMIKVYLMAVGGGTTQLGGVACSLLDVLADICEENFDEAYKQINKLLIGIAKIIYTATIERLEDLGDTGAATHKSALTRIEHEIDPLPHLLFLKSILVDASICAKCDYTAMTHKLQELINDLKS